jgi:hypothetical protein
MKSASGKPSPRFTSGKSCKRGVMRGACWSSVRRRRKFSPGVRTHRAHTASAMVEPSNFMLVTFVDSSRFGKGQRASRAARHLVLSRAESSGFVTRGRRVTRAGFHGAGASAAIDLTINARCTMVSRRWSKHNAAPMTFFDPERAPISRNDVQVDSGGIWASVHPGKGLGRHRTGFW